MGIAFLSANLNGVDAPAQHVSQSVPYDSHVFTDENFPPRFNSLKPRLQAKIPKCFGWQMAPGYDFYLWLDGSLTMKSQDTVKYFYDQCRGYDVVVFQHPRRDTVHWEGRYLYRGMKQEKSYLCVRYMNELLDEQMAEIEGDKDFKDDMLVNGGLFMYRNTPEVHAMLKEWWYHISRYLIMDQCSFSYVLKKSGLRVNVRPETYSDCHYFSYTKHRHRNR